MQGVVVANNPQVRVMSTGNSVSITKINSDTQSKPNPSAGLCLNYGKDN